MARLLAWLPHTPSWMSCNIACPSWGVTHLCKTLDMLFLYSSPLTTTNALDHRIILRALMTSLGSVLFTIYAKYGCIQVTLTIMTSSGSELSSSAAISSPKSSANCGFCFLYPKIWYLELIAQLFLPKKLLVVLVDIGTRCLSEYRLPCCSLYWRVILRTCRRFLPDSNISSYMLSYCR
jgi:hypothetical protein